MMIQLSDYFPALATLPAITVAGIGLIAASLVLYMFSRAPEFLMVTFTATIYAAIPLLPIH
jgi:hypothetical protein